jgi:hypothetical protein
VVLSQTVTVDSDKMTKLRKKVNLTVVWIESLFINSAPHGAAREDQWALLNFPCRDSDDAIWAVRDAAAAITTCSDSARALPSLPRSPYAITSESISLHSQYQSSVTPSASRTCP